MPSRHKHLEFRTKPGAFVAALFALSLLMRLTQAHAGPTAIFFYEDNAGGLECISKFGTSLFGNARTFACFDALYSGER